MGQPIKHYTAQETWRQTDGSHHRPVDVDDDLFTRPYQPPATTQPDTMRNLDLSGLTADRAAGFPYSVHYIGLCTVAATEQQSAAATLHLETRMIGGGYG